MEVYIACGCIPNVEGTRDAKRIQELGRIIGTFQKKEVLLVLGCGKLADVSRKKTDA
jgi:hypothetical protein